MPLALHASAMSVANAATALQWVITVFEQPAVSRRVSAVAFDGSFLFT
jgi:hypothetical protein